MGEPLDMIDCARRNLRLTRGGCARLWESVQPARGKVGPGSWEGRHVCVYCPIGAANAGKAQNPIEALRATIATVCTSCNNDTDRIIRGLWCPSCYNRRLEVVRGVNRKGGKPRLTLLLRSVRLIVGEGEALRFVHRDSVLSPTEAALALARCATAPMTFGRPGIAW